ncbi:MAG: hypothetical protein HDQ88_09395 [Clostridia bacterium]|nr:hypothetical protein [Clostridia bacterium]
MRVIEFLAKDLQIFVPYESITDVEKRKVTGLFFQNKWVVKIFVGLMVIASLSFTDEAEADDLYCKLKKDMENYDNTGR